MHSVPCLLHSWDPDPRQCPAHGRRVGLPPCLPEERRHTTEGLLLEPPSGVDCASVAPGLPSSGRPAGLPGVPAPDHLGLTDWTVPCQGHLPDSHTRHVHFVWKLESTCAREARVTSEDVRQNDERVPTRFPRHPGAAAHGREAAVTPQTRRRHRTATSDVAPQRRHVTRRDA